jgi:hypothetical protein
MLSTDIRRLLEKALVDINGEEVMSDIHKKEPEERDTAILNLEWKVTRLKFRHLLPFNEHTNNSIYEAYTSFIGGSKCINLLEFICPMLFTA